MSPQTLHVLAGPTAVGKTAAALDWAVYHNAEIISCDALLVYRGMDIGTAKPTPEERARVPHHCLDLAGPGQRLSVRDYLEAARTAVSEILGRGRAVLITGGSGFYLKGFFAPVVDAFDIPDEASAEAERVLAEGGLEGALQRLRGLGGGGLGRLDTRNPRRVLKALERGLATGLSVPEQEARHARAEGWFAGYRKRVCLLSRGREDLHARIARRTRAMMEAGLVEEVRALRAAGFEGNPAASSAIGYRETLQWLDGTLPGGAGMEALAEAIEASTRQLVRKQETWLRKQIPVDTVRVPRPDEPAPASLF